MFSAVLFVRDDRCGLPGGKTRESRQQTRIEAQEFLLGLAKLGRRSDTGPSVWQTFWQCEPLFLIRVN